MNSSFFLFCAFYFLVGFVALVGYLWQDSRFYILALINFVCLFLYFFVSSLLKKHIKSDVDVHSASESKEKSVDHQSHIHQFVKYPYGAAKKISKKRRKILLWTLIVLFLFVSVMAFRQYVQWSTLRDFFVGEGNVSHTLFTGNGEVIGSGFSELLSGEEQSSVSSVLTGFSETGVVVDSGNSDISSPKVNDMFLGKTETGVSDDGDQQVSPSQTIRTKLGLNDITSLTMMDGIVYLLDVNSIVLSSKKDISFSYVTPKNPYYAYWRTAYEKRLIGKDNSPSKLMLCETYITLKGMIEGWKVKYTSTTVKSAFWAEAKKRNVLNGCVFGKVVKGKNL